jgi:hypothetical protein
MRKFRVVVATSFDVEAEDSIDAECVAYDQLKKEIGKAAADAVWEVFGVNVEEIGKAET